MPQGPIATLLYALNPFKQARPVNSDSNGNLIISGQGGTNNALFIRAPGECVKAAAGVICVVNVLAAGSGTGTINDCTGTAAAVTANEIAVIPETVGPISLNFPCLLGITVVPGTGQQVSVSYQ